MNEPSDKDLTLQEDSAPVEESPVVDEEAESVEDMKEVISDFSNELRPIESASAETVSGEVQTQEVKNTLNLLGDLELSVSIELVRKQMLVRDILRLGEGSIIEFNKAASEMVDLLVNNKKIAEGEVVVIEDRFGIRISRLVNPAERIKNLEQ